ncbi:MAG: hypothetical protein JOZ78_01960 [Chroococcidiopsidaceae cyanobacterium CP_BM_ER_R8_30]|nr:hypothetical protein [Chroococcidiopsidaceae cyanobacterium CP_BM_ER_R8_30]
MRCAFLKLAPPQATASAASAFGNVKALGEAERYQRLHCRCTTVPALTAAVIAVCINPCYLN